jgi:hypothetical protein
MDLSKLVSAHGIRHELTDQFGDTPEGHKVGGTLAVATSLS